MPLTLVTNPKIFIDLNAKKRLDIIDKLQIAQRNVILEEFDNAELDAEKQGCIDCCTLLDFNDLRDQLTAELQMERLISNTLNN